MIVLSATGHRPNKLGGYSRAARDRLDEFALAQLQRYAPVEVVSGFALGWDQSIARAAIALGIPLTAALPFYSQACTWPTESKTEWARLLSLASRCVIVSPGGFDNRKMQKRNEWMADNSTMLLALWNGTPGGTANCMHYANNRQHLNVINVWREWAACN